MLDNDCWGMKRLYICYHPWNFEISSFGSVHILLYACKTVLEANSLICHDRYPGTTLLHTLFQCQNSLKSLESVIGNETCRMFVQYFMRAQCWGWHTYPMRSILSVFLLSNWWLHRALSKEKSGSVEHIAMVGDKVMKDLENDWSVVTMAWPQSPFRLILHGQFSMTSFKGAYWYCVLIAPVIMLLGVFFLQQKTQKNQQTAVWQCHCLLMVYVFRGILPHHKGLPKWKKWHGVD